METRGWANHFPFKYLSRDFETTMTSIKSAAMSTRTPINVHVRFGSLLPWTEEADEEEAL